MGYGIEELTPDLSGESMLALWLGAASFFVGLAISGFKAGLGHRITSWVGREWRSLIVELRKPTA